MQQEKPRSAETGPPPVTVPSTPSAPAANQELLHAVQQPLDKARGVEGTLQQEAQQIDQRVDGGNP